MRLGIRERKIPVLACFLFLFQFFLAVHGQAAGKDPAWELAVVFFGAAEAETFQADIDRNILELAQVMPGKNLSISILRDFEDRTVVFRPDPNSQTTRAWDPLFFHANPPGIEVSGEFRVHKKKKGEAALVDDLSPLKKFLKDSFLNPDSKRILLFWGHGLGVGGIQGISLPGLREFLIQSLPARGAGGTALDILWWDACFMASVEVAYEFSGLANYMIASEAAEFASGAPFQAFSELEKNPADLDSLAKGLAHEFISSYSYLGEGSQRDSVLRNPATISVIDLDRIPALVDHLKTLVKKSGRLTAAQRKALGSTAELRNTSLESTADLVVFLKNLQQVPGLAAVAASEAQAIVETLDGMAKPRLLTDQRLRVAPPKGFSKAWLVYGYGDWIYGYEGDDFTFSKISAELRSESFLPGALGMNWPYLEISEKKSIAPFGVDRNLFNYFYADPSTGKRISGEKRILRREDSELVQFTAKNAGNPVRFSAYTQGVGESAERFFGISIFDRAFPVSADLLNSKFADATDWGNL